MNEIQNTNQNATINSEVSAVSSVSNPILNLSFLSILKESWVIFKNKGKDLAIIMAIPLVVLFDLLFVISVIIGISMKSYSIAEITHGLVVNILAWSYSDGYALNTVLCLIIAAIFLITVYFSIRSLIASIKLIKSEEGHPITIHNAWKVSFRSIKSTLWVVCILAAILVGGYMLVIVPALILATFYVNSIFAHVVDNKNGVDALTTSRRVVRGFGPFVFVNYLMLLAGSYAIITITQKILVSVSLSILYVLHGHYGLAILLFNFIVAFLIWLVVGLLVKAFCFIFGFVMYKRLKLANNIPANISDATDHSENSVQALSTNSPVESKDRNVVIFWAILGVVATLTIIFLVMVFGSRYDNNDDGSYGMYDSSYNDTYDGSYNDSYYGDGSQDYGAMNDQNDQMMDDYASSTDSAQ